MSENKKISGIRIFVSLTAVIGCVVMKTALNTFSIEKSMINAVSLSTAGFILCMLNSSLYVTHWQRFKQNKNDRFLFTAIGIIIFAAVFWMNHAFIHAQLEIVNITEEHHKAVLPLLILVNCIVAPINFMVLFKLLTGL